MELVALAFAWELMEAFGWRDCSLRTCLLACTSNGLVVVVEDDADLVHKSDLLFVVTIQFIVAC